MESRNESFFEDVFSCKSKVEPNSSKRAFETINENSQDGNDTSEVEPTRSKKARIKKIFWSRFSDLHARRGTSNLQRGSELYIESHVERSH